MKPEELINYSKLSKYLTNNNNSIRKDKCAKKHKEKVEKLLMAIEQWMKGENFIKLIEVYNKGFFDGVKFEKNRIKKRLERVTEKL